MIEPQYRFWIDSRQDNGIETKNTIIDWDQRRYYTVTGPSSLLLEDEDLAIDILEKYVKNVDRDVYAIVVDDKGSVLSTSSDPRDDPTFAENFPSYMDVPSLQDCSVVNFSELEEVGRLSQGVDLVRYVDEAGTQKTVVFKYSLIFQRTPRIWKELHLLKSLPKHPNLISLDRIVVDGTQSQIVGFTTPYVTGGTFDDNRQHVFRLSCLNQLTSVVDYLNLELGIVHQDIAPRNLLIDHGASSSETDQIRLFDFNYAARIGLSGCIEGTDDVAGVIFTFYELVTLDDSYRRVSWKDQEPEKVLNLEEWPLNRKLDCELALFRQHLNAWVQQRRKVDKVKQNAESFTEVADIPGMPPPRPVITGMDSDGNPIYESCLVQMRADALRLHNHVTSWERPPSMS